MQLIVKKDTSPGIGDFVFKIQLNVGFEIKVHAVLFSRYLKYEILYFVPDFYISLLI